VDSIAHYNVLEPALADQLLGHMLGQADAPAEAGQVFKYWGDRHVHSAASSNSPVSAGMLPGGDDSMARDDDAGNPCCGDGAPDIGLTKDGGQCSHQSSSFACWSETASVPLIPSWLA
jgi:hypothetical protein